MKLTIGSDLSEASFRFAAEFGVTHVKIDSGQLMDTAHRGPVQRDKLLTLMGQLAGYGLTIGVALLPQGAGAQHWNIRLGRPEREQEIKHVCESIRTLGGEGIGVIEYVFNLAAVFGSESLPNGRGGAVVRHYDHDKALEAAPVPEFAATAEEVWDRIAWFLERVIPVAEEAGVKMALHPDDPPVPTLRGETRVLGSLEGLEKLLALVPSDSNCLNFCQGTVAEMGVDVIDAIRSFGSRGKIQHVHFRNVQGAVPRFDESFIDDGDVDMFEALAAYKEVGYTGTIMPDHWPASTDGSPFTGRAFALGYMKAMMRAMDVLETPSETGD
jgi:mannonate dehydratase